MITPETVEQMRQFEVVAKVAIQLGHYACGGVGKRPGRIALHKIGRAKFGLTDHQTRVCVARAQMLLRNVSTSVSSETLLIAQRRRHFRIAA